MAVVDASALVEVLLRTPSAKAVDRRLGRSRTLHAPHLIDIEIAHVLRRYALAGVIGVERGLEALADLAEFPLRRYPHANLLPRMWELRSNFSSYDAAYVALAEALDEPLITCDGRLSAAVSRHSTIELA